MTATRQGAVDLSVEAWTRPAKLPPLGANCIHIWRLRPLARLSAETYQPFLQPEEIARAARLHFAADQWQSVASRATLRLLLAHYAGETPPQHLALAFTERGKPYLPGSRIHFNLSHTRDLAIFAFARELQIGIDVERVRATDDVRSTDDLGDVAQQNFSPSERSALRSLPETERAHAFYRCWTRKEALLKAEGSGLFRSLDSFAVSLLPGDPAELVDAAWDAAWSKEEGARWSLAHLDVDADAIGAVAWQRREPRPSLMLLDWSAALLPQTP